MKKTWLVVWVIVIALLAAGLYYKRGSRTVPIRDVSGKPLPHSVAALESVELGGMRQWILVRGRDARNPLLLWLHGGPGAAQMSVAQRFNADLEEAFVVVHWDQRGAGKSNPPDFDPASMTFAQYVSDAHQLTQLLKDRFGAEKIYLLGHSWGTQVGIRLAQAYPQDYYAYIGVSQVVNAAAAQQIGYTWLEEKLQQRGDRRGLAQLQTLGAPPYRDHDAYVRYINLVDTCGGGFDLPFSSLAWAALMAPEYSLADMLAWLQGANRGSGTMWDDPEYAAFDALTQIPRLDLPVYFFSGRKDYNTPLELVQRYAAALDAPEGKQVVVFEASAHTPFLAEGGRFYAQMRRVREETLRR